jgi:hypothetical protein
MVIAAGPPRDCCVAGRIVPYQASILHLWLARRPHSSRMLYEKDHERKQLSRRECRSAFRALGSAIRVARPRPLYPEDLLVWGSSLGIVKAARLGRLPTPYHDGARHSAMYRHTVRGTVDNNDVKREDEVEDEDEDEELYIYERRRHGAFKVVQAIPIGITT